MDIRSEQPGDERFIHELTVNAFKPMPFSSGAEAPIINELRQDGDLTISLVAEDNGQIIGHIAFSPVTIDGVHGGWFALGPVSVRPDRQNSGIGSRLINEGLMQLRSLAATGCALIGSPDYYGRFGFRSDGNLHYGQLPDHHVQWLSFGSSTASGVLKFAPAFQRWARR